MHARAPGLITSDIEVSLYHHWLIWHIYRLLPIRELFVHRYYILSRNQVFNRSFLRELLVGDRRFRVGGVIILALAHVDELLHELLVLQLGYRCTRVNLLLLRAVFLLWNEWSMHWLSCIILDDLVCWGDFLACLRSILPRDGKLLASMLEILMSLTIRKIFLRGCERGVKLRATIRFATKRLLGNLYLALIVAYRVCQCLVRGAVTFLILIGISD